MSKRILLIESDPRFAGEIKAGFEQLGVSLEVVDDGQSGLERAASVMPDLILLSIELPGMNGFLVCKKIKKSPGLDQIPLIILSSEATEETFEQHKKLKTHAEDYVRKPVSFEQLLDHVKKFLPIETVDAPAEDEELEIKGDEIYLESESMPPPPPPEPRKDSFAGVRIAGVAAPGLSNELSAISAPEMARGVVSNRQRPSASSALSIDLQEMSGPGKDRPIEVEGAMPEPPTKPRLDGDVSRADSDEELVKVRGELENYKQRLAATEKALQEIKNFKAKEGGVSSREFLDLREQLNRKDRELLSFRD